MTALASLLCAVVLSSVALAGRLPKEHTPRAAADVAAPMPFEPAEELVYEGEFSKLFLRGIKIAELKFTAARPRPAVANVAAVAGGVPVKPAPLLFTSDIESKGWFRKLFGINFRFHAESTVEPDSFAVLRTTKQDEQGKRVRTSEAVFDHDGRKIVWTERDPNNPQGEPRVVSAPLNGATQDIISVIYFLRAQPLIPGKTIVLAVSDSGQVYSVPVQVFAEKKKVKSVVGKVSVVRLDVGLFGEGRPVRGSGKMSLWLTDDARRLPVRGKISNDMGTLELTLKRVNVRS